MKHSDPRWQEHLEAIDDDLSRLQESASDKVASQVHDRMQLSLLNITADNVVLAEPLTEWDSHIELGIYPPMTNAVKLGRKLQPGEIVLLQMNENTVRQAVVHRDDDVLTSDQLKQHWPEVQKAMLKELLTREKAHVF